ncbi:MAG TPA: class I SAM-dependent methyltransferase [Terriglobales bacterium]|nr:class I SAM-dependent methyltransferase [Terriglobales bacterium]
MANFASAQQLIDAHFSTWAPYWREVYDGDTVQSAIYRERLDLVLRWVDELAPTLGGESLDIGCGAGLFSVALAKRGFRVRAIDTVEAMRTQTSRLALTEGVQEQVITEHGDAHHLRYTNATFDLVLAIGVTPWLHSPEMALKEVYRVLRPGGYLIITADNQIRLSHWLDPRFCPLHAAIRARIGTFLRSVSLWHQSHVRMYSPLAFDRALSVAGFSKVEGLTLGYGPFTFFDRQIIRDRIGIAIHKKLKNLATRNSLLRRVGSQYVVLARKS